LVVIEEIREATTVKQESEAMARSLGLRTGLQALPDVERNIPTEAQQQEIEIAIAAFLRLLPRFSEQQKYLVYEQVVKSCVRVAA
jgi:hypothetical protein